MLPIPRIISPEYLGINFTTFQELRAKRPLHKLVNTTSELSDNYKVFDENIQYLIETVSDLRSKKNEITTLWNLAYKIISEDFDYDIQSINDTYLLALVSITGEANFEPNEIRNFISKLEDAIRSNLESKLSQKQAFRTALRDVVDWYQLEFEYLKYLGSSFVANEYTFLINIIKDNLIALEEIKLSSPLLFIEFAGIIKFIYKSLQLDYKPENIRNYLNIALQQIIVARNNGYYNNFSTLLEDYYSVKLSSRKSLNWVYKNFTGYGEKPWNLFWMFLIINFLFAVPFSFFSSSFCIQPAAPSNFLERLAYFISFNNTTMLTVGYGDIYPIDVAARAAVMLLQLIGFAISSTAVALFLRKLLRF